MRFRSALASILLLVPGWVAAQHGHGESPPLRAAPPEASQFDFLLGQWEIVAHPRLAGLAARLHGSPEFPGTWKAWRGFDGWGIEDEIRLSDASGNPRGLTHHVRIYDATAKHWNIASVDVYRSSIQQSTADWQGHEMQVSGRGSDSEGRAYVSRARFRDITPNGFRYEQDRSYDEGRTWTEGFLKIEAKRVAAVAPR